MKNLMPWTWWIPRYEITKIERMIEELGKVGEIEAHFFESDVPYTIFGEPRRGKETEKDKSNHAIIEIDGREAVEFFKQRLISYRSRFYYENLSEDDSKEVEELLTKYDYYTGDKLAEKKLWFKVILDIVPLLGLLNVALSILLLLRPWGCTKWEIFDILEWSFFTIVFYKQSRIFSIT